ncbi:Xylulose kinase [archaeon HR06]|nr:Xylulose kinase [archaeon HR06]
MILSLDIGTLGAKVGLLNEDLNLIYQRSQEYKINHPKLGWAEQDPEVWWKTIKSLLKGLDLREVKAIGISNTCPSLIAMDEEGKALRPAILYMDQRSLKQAEKIKKKLGLNRIFKVTGNRISPGTLSLTSLLWIKEEEPEVYKKAKLFVHANGYIAFKLTDNAAMDPSNASLTGLFDIRRIRWSEELVEDLDLDLSKLPKILWSYERVGYTSKEASRELGINEGIPVIIGAADTACAALGLGLIREGQAFETTGTSSVLAFLTNKDNFDIRLLNRCYVKENLWLFMGAMSTTGAALRWFKDNFSYKDYKDIDEEAREGSSNNLIFLPYMMGERCPLWDPYARGVLIGLSLNHRRGDIARAIMEGVAYGLRNNLEILESLGLEVKEIRVTGAAAKSKIWCEIKANILKKRIIIPNIKETTLLGVAILALSQSSSKLESLADKIYQKGGEIIEPSYLEKYDKYYEIFKESYKSLKKIFRKMVS